MFIPWYVIERTIVAVSGNVVRMFIFAWDVSSAKRDSVRPSSIDQVICSNVKWNY